MPASERDRQTVADQHIGNVLYYYPPDPSDSAWPHIELRNSIEELQSDDIEKGIAIEQYTQEELSRMGYTKVGIKSALLLNSGGDGSYRGYTMAQNPEYA